MCWKEDSMAMLRTGFGKSMCYVLPPPPPPSHFGQGKIIYMQIISHDTLQLS